jgi:hypothetical protein
MTAYDDNLVPMGAVTVTLTQASPAGFLGLQGATNIRRIVITEAADNAQVGIFDDLRFEFVNEEAPAPEPDAQARLRTDQPPFTAALAPLALVMSFLAVRLGRRREDA